MTRSIWLKTDDIVGNWKTRKRRITAGLEAGVGWVLVDKAGVERTRELDDVNIAAFQTSTDVYMMGAEENDRKPAALADAYTVGKDGEGDAAVEFPSDFSGSTDLTTLHRSDDLANGSYVRTLSRGCEAFAEKAARDDDYATVIGEDRAIIPLENLIAHTGKKIDLITGVTTAEEAKTAFETLELGSDGVLLDSDNPDEIRKAVEIRGETERESLDLVWAEVIEVECTDMADRVCADTDTIMDRDKGMLVGSMARGLFFVRAETTKSPYVASRPFRVNAGTVHAYARTSDSGTVYLSELENSDEVQLTDTNGSTREAVVGRVKIGKRPMFRISVDYGGNRVTTLLQDAKTVKVHTRESRIAVTDLEPGNEMLIYYENTTRHFGEAVEESIIEK